MSIGQARLDILEDEPKESDPQIYLASPLTHIADDEKARRLVGSEIEIISKAIDECTRNADPRWLVRLHAPIQWTAPWNAGDTRSPPELYAANRRLVIGDTDALIIHGYGGGSMGVGQEFVWATELGVPILYVHHKEEPVSRQLEGTPALLTVAAFADPAQLADVTRCFIRDNRTLIELGPIRRRNRKTRFLPLQVELQGMWANLSQHQQQSVAATAGTSTTHVDFMVADLLEIGMAPIHLLTALGAGLGVDVVSALGRGPLPELGVGQIRALVAAADEQAWGEDTVAHLMDQGRLELARSAVRRFRLDTPDDWLRLHDAL